MAKAKAAKRAGKKSSSSSSPAAASEAKHAVGFEKTDRGYRCRQCNDFAPASIDPAELEQHIHGDYHRSN